LRIWHKSVTRFPRYFIHKQKVTAPKTDLTQFTACGNHWPVFASSFERKETCSRLHCFHPMTRAQCLYCCPCTFFSVSVSIASDSKQVLRSRLPGHFEDDPSPALPCRYLANIVPEHRLSNLHSNCYRLKY